MKKTYNLCILYTFVLLFYLALHLLTFFGILPRDLLWDTTLNDNKSLFITEVIFIFTFGTIFIYFCKTLQRKRIRSVPRLKNVLRVLAVVFILEFIGALSGTETIYKTFGTFFYLFETVFTVFLLIQCDRLKKRGSKANSAENTSTQYYRKKGDPKKELNTLT